LVFKDYKFLNLFYAGKLLVLDLYPFFDELDNCRMLGKLGKAIKRDMVAFGVFGRLFFTPKDTNDEKIPSRYPISKNLPTKGKKSFTSLARTFLLKSPGQ